MDYSEMKSLLSSVDDPVSRLELVIDFGTQLVPILQSALCAEIAGCASRVQICNDKGQFYGTADSALVRGIVAIIIAMKNSGVIDLRNEFSSLKLNLGAGRLNGVESMIKVISKQ